MVGMSDDELEENLRYLESHGYPLTAAERETIKWGNFIVRLSLVRKVMLNKFNCRFKHRIRLFADLC
jgi:hypothetical protein